MQVSPLFNSIVAPILYHTLKLDGSKGVFDHVSPTKTIKGRKTLPKNRNLAHIKILDKVIHDPHGCRLHGKTQGLRVDMIRVIASADDYHLHSPCDCLERIGHRKLLQRDWIFSYRAIPVRREIDTIILGPLLQLNGRRQWRSLAQRLVIVVRTGPTPPESDKVQNESNWKNFEDRLIDTLLQEPEFTRDITFVNTETFIARIAEPHGTENMSRCDLAAEYMKTRFDAKVKIEAKLSPIITEIRSTKFTFVTMNDYLANYDWKGELNDEEIRPWLDIRDQGR
jgi:hypothetical protein